MEDVEVDINSGGNSKAVIEGKTSVPFRSFVTLILQRKVQALFKTNQNDPVIVSSTLLTALASAPGDKQEDRAKLVTVTFFSGVLIGLFLSAATLLILKLLQIELGIRDLSVILGVIIFIVVLGALLQKNQKKSVFSEKLYEAMEKTTDILP